MVKESTRKGRLVQERMRKQSCHAALKSDRRGQLRADAMYASTFRPPALTVFAQHQLRGIFVPVSDHHNDYNNAKSALVDMPALLLI